VAVELAAEAARIGADVLHQLQAPLLNLAQLHAGNQLIRLNEVRMRDASGLAQVALLLAQDLGHAPHLSRVHRSAGGATSGGARRGLVPAGPQACGDGGAAAGGWCHQAVQAPQGIHRASGSFTCLALPLRIYKFPT